MIDILWGVKTEALFDVWSLEHILSGISFGSTAILVHKQTVGQLAKNVCDTVMSAKKKARIITKQELIFVLFLAYAWETIEHYLETGLAGPAVEYWFQGVEMWGNRLITDPLMLVLGYIIAKKWSQMVLPARILSVIWLVVHIFVFPHSMYLHDLLGI